MLLQTEAEGCRREQGCECLPQLLELYDGKQTFYGRMMGGRRVPKVVVLIDVGDVTVTLVSYERRLIKIKINKGSRS
jgi:hypothetical protein